jgi:hypothetical protein
MGEEQANQHARDDGISKRTSEMKMHRKMDFAGSQCSAQTATIMSLFLEG